jgi:hypothetical protein
MSHNDSSALIGRTIAGKFVIEEMIAVGGTGTVYRARHLGLDRMVALKVLREEFARDADFIERFKREARAASRLEHPNSVRVLDFGQDEGSLLYLAMEYVEGRTLYQVIHEDSPLGDERIVDILSQVLAAVGVAHDMEVIHRDLKPENIMILRGKSDEGEHAEVAKVLDFGIASLGSIVRGTEAEGPRMTKQGLLVGTPEYMAPEQAGGERADRRSDLYSAGVVMYHMLAKRLPFSGDSPLTVAVKHITEPPPAPSLFAPVNPKLEVICLRALSKAPDERFASAREMRAALRAAINLAPGRASAPVSVFSGGDRNTGAFIGAMVAASRRRRTPLLVGLMLATLFVGVVGARALLRPRHAPLATPAPSTSAGTAQASSGASSGASSASGAESPVRDPARTPLTLATARPPEEPSPAERPTPRPETGPAFRRSKNPGAHASRDKSRRAARGALVVNGTGAAAGAGSSRTGNGPAGAPYDAPRTTNDLHASVSSALIQKASQPAAPPVVRPPLDINRAAVSIASIATSSGIAGSNIRSALSRAPIARCYRDALRAAGTAAEGSAVLHLRMDIAGYVTGATLEGAQFLPGVKSCVEKAARIARVKDVDTGEATADITLNFACTP